MHPLHDLRRGRRHRDLRRLGYGPFWLMDFFPGTGIPGGEWWSVLWPSPEGVLQELGGPRGETSGDLCRDGGYLKAPVPIGEARVEPRKDVE